MKSKFQKIKKLLQIKCQSYYFIFISYWKIHIEMIVFIVQTKMIFVQFCKNWRFHDHVLCNHNVHVTRNYVYMTLKTHKKPNIFFEIYCMHVSY